MLCKVLIASTYNYLGMHAWCLIFAQMILYFLCALPPVRIYYMFDLIQAAPNHPSPQPTMFQSCWLLVVYFCCFTTTIIVTIITPILPLLLILCCKQALISGAVELITQLSNHVRILWLPPCRIYKLGYSYPRRLSRSLTLVGHQELFSGAVAGEHSFIYRST